MSARTLNALVLGALGAAAIILGLILFTGGTTHTLRAGFDNVIQLTPGQQVRIAGRPVGELGKIKLVQGQAVVEIKITDDDAWPLPKGTTARSRWGSTTAYLTRYVELYPGPKDAGNLEDGAILTSRTAFELDESYRIFKQDTDRQTSRLLSSLGDGLEDEGDDLNRGLAAAPRGLDAVGDLARELAADEERLRTLAVAGDETTSALAAQSEDLKALITNAAGTVQEFAAHTQAQQQALDRAPKTFDQTTGTLSRLDTSLDKLDALVSDIRPGAPALRDLATTARGTLSELRTVSPLVSSTLDKGTVAAPRLTRLFNTAAPFFPNARRALTTFNPMFDCLRPYGPEIAGFLETWTGQLKNYDAFGHYARSFPLTVIPALPPGTGNTSEAALNLQQGTLTYAMPRAPGLNAGKPWLRPQCGTGPDSLNANKDPEAGNR
jgi:ABC-type transporter Mla subunit MlaD